MRKRVLSPGWVPILSGRQNGSILQEGHLLQRPFRRLRAGLVHHQSGNLSFLVSTAQLWMLHCIMSDSHQLAVHLRHRLQDHLLCVSRSASSDWFLLRLLRVQLSFVVAVGFTRFLVDNDSEYNCQHTEVWQGE